MSKQTGLESFVSSWLQELDSLEARWQGGDHATQSEIDAEIARWRARLGHEATANEEWFDIVNPLGEPLGLLAPRWFAHLTGLRHRGVDVLFTTPQGLLLLQVRAHNKPEWPERWDTTVGGHLKAGQNWESGVLAEIQEEIGLAPGDRHRWLAETRLIPVGGPFELYGRYAGAPPFRNRQVNQLYAGTLTAWGLTHLHFADGELGGILLVTPEEAHRLIQRGDDRIAPGLLGVFPKWWRFTRASSRPK